MAQASMDTIDAAAGAGEGLFLRKATGLVRDISVTDAFLFNAVGMNVGLGALFMLQQAPAFFPNGNMIVAAIIGTLLMAFSIQWVYSEFAAAMPRSGGDYVFTSRAIHPFIGWILGWNQAIWLIFFWIGFNAWALCQFTLPPTLQILAQTTGISGLADLGTTIATPLGTFVVGSVVNVLFAYLVLTRRYWGWQRITIIFAFAAVIIPALLAVISGASGMKTAWDGFVAGQGSGLTYDQIVPKAQDLGYTGPSGGFDLGATILMLPWVFFVVGFGVGPAQISGEIKRAGRSMWYALFGSILFNGLMLAAVLWLVVSGLGEQWVTSLGFLATNHGADLGVPAGINFLGSILGGNIIIALIIFLGFVAWALNGTPASELQATRYMLAASLDRMIPAALGEVDERTHSPRNAIILCTIAGELSILGLIAIPQASLLGALMAQIIAYIIVGIAGIVFPYRMRDVWQAASGRTIFGVPSIALAGAAAVVVLGGQLFLFVTNNDINSFFGVTRDISLMVAGIVIATGIVWYLGAWYYNRGRGIDTNLVYRSIPPD
ncbi:MAG TPA: APC family permease [Candidatus Limnocylindrales bacterium]|jgi:amino acid transporter|nr:APC family permease [Candidatus Limnocylindrales bacterium]